MKQFQRHTVDNQYTAIIKSYSKVMDDGILQKKMHVLWCILSLDMSFLYKNTQMLLHSSNLTITKFETYCNCFISYIWVMSIISLIPLNFNIFMWFKCPFHRNYFDIFIKKHFCVLLNILNIIYFWVFYYKNVWYILAYF